MLTGLNTGMKTEVCEFPSAGRGLNSFPCMNEVVMLRKIIDVEVCLLCDHQSEDAAALDEIPPYDLHTSKKLIQIFLSFYAFFLVLLVSSVHLSKRTEIILPPEEICLKVKVAPQKMKTFLKHTDQDFSFPRPFAKPQSLISITRTTRRCNSNR